MADAINPIDYVGETKAVFLAKVVSDGTYADVIETLKTDQPGQETTATGISTSAGQILGNLIDDFFLASYDLIRQVATGLIAGDLTLDSASPTLTVGDGTGSPDLILDKSEAGASQVRLQKLGSDSWVVEHTSTEDLSIFNAALNPFSHFAQTTLKSSWYGDMALASASPIVTVGDATGSPTMAINKSETGTGAFIFQKLGSQSWAWKNDSSELLVLQKAAGVQVLGFSQSTSLATFAADVTVNNDAVVKGGLSVAPSNLASSPGQLAISASNTDSANKLGVIVAPQFLNANGNTSVIQGRNETANNKVNIGGGVTGLDAATDINFYTGAAVNTAIGTIRMSIDSAGDVAVKNDLEIDGDLNHDGTNIGFYGTAPVAKPTVTGSRGGNAALASLLTALASQGILTDSSSA